jgi:putative transposase
MRVQLTRVILLFLSGDAPIFMKGVVHLVSCLFISIMRRVYVSFQTLKKRFSHWIKPPTTSLLLGTFTDMSKGKSELLAENALLRHQLLILRRQVKRPIFRKRDRLLLVLLVRMVRTWQQALFIFQPETMLRWHRQLSRLFWKRTSKVHSIQPRISLETITLIKEMATNNRL